MPPTKTSAQALHVCFVAPFGLRQKTTVWARTLPLAKELVQRGEQATILIPPWDSKSDAGKGWSEDGVEVVNVALSGGIPAITRRLLQEIHRRQPEIVHVVKPRAHAGLVQWSLWQQRARRTQRIVLDVDDWEQAWSEINQYSWPVARFLAWQEEWGIRHADGITAASRWLVERTGEYAPHTPVLYLPNGIDAQLSGEGPLTVRTGGAVLFFTRFVEVTPEWLAQFIVSLHEIDPATHLIVAGTPVRAGLEEPFREAVAATAVGGSVEWLGFVPPEQMPAVYERSTCAIFPAAPVPLQMAKCSVRLATTLLRGVPVVASDVGEQAAYGGEGAALLVKAAAPPSEFAAAVSAVLRQPEQQAQLAAAAQARLLQRYAWSYLADSLVDFYTKLMPAEIADAPEPGSRV